MTIETLGLDLGKNWIHMVGFDGEGSIVLRRRVRRHQLPALTANMPACMIGMEACSGAHHLARALEAQGHEPRLMPPQYVKPFVKANKNDYRDAEANAEAVRRPTMRFVPVKNEAQLDPTDHPPCAAAAGGPAYGTDQPVAGHPAGTGHHGATDPPGSRDQAGGHPGR
jgi:hypothetical protein